MILYGRSLSPYTRRVEIWCALQGRRLERRRIMVTGEDFDKLKAMNPVGRVPVLELDDGTRLTESWAICDWLDETSPNGWRGLPPSGEARRDAFQQLAMASGISDKAVALVYERNRRPEEFHWMDWQQRLVAQIQGGLSACEDWIGVSWAGETPNGPEIAAVISYHFVQITNPWVLEPGYPKLAALFAQASEMPAFIASQPET